MVFSVTRCRPKSAITVPCSLVCSRYRLSRRASSSSRSRRCLRRRAARRRGVHAYQHNIFTHFTLCASCLVHTTTLSTVQMQDGWHRRGGRSGSRGRSQASEGRPLMAVIRYDGRQGARLVDLCDVVHERRPLRRLRHRHVQLRCHLRRLRPTCTSVMGRVRARAS